MKTMTLHSDFVYLVLITVLGFTSLFLLYIAYDRGEEIKKQQRVIDTFDKRYIVRQGGTRLNNDEMLNYNLMSFDGGQIWYAIEYGKNWEVYIIGTADSVYPGLIEHLDAWEKIRAYIDEHGEINKDNITPELQVLMDKVKLKIK